MKIALNCSIATSTRTGTGQYAANLTAALMQADHNHEFIIYCDDTMVDWFADRRNGHPVDVRGMQFWSAAHRIFWEQSQLGPDLKQNGATLLHSMAFTSPYRSPAKTVVTVHDLVFRNYPQTISFTKRLYYNPVFVRSVRRAHRIIAVSKTIRTELMRAFPLAGDKVVVIAEAAGPEFLERPSEAASEQTCERLCIKPPYLLTVATQEPRKNLAVLIKAFDQIKRELELPHQLILTGKTGWPGRNEPEVSKILTERKDIVCTGYVEQDQMPALYAGADLFLSASLYEGFGLPPLEAFASGTPVLASDIPVHREVLGDAAIFVKPHDPQQWKNAMAGLLEDVVIMKKLRLKGLNRVKEFSWKKAAEKTLEVYGMDGSHEKS